MRDVSLKRTTAASVPDIASRGGTSRRYAIITLVDEIRGWMEKDVHALKVRVCFAARDVATVWHARNGDSLCLFCSDIKAIEITSYCRCS